MIEQAVLAEYKKVAAGEATSKPPTILSSFIP
jgi:hypothetical protein